MTIPWPAVALQDVFVERREVPPEAALASGHVRVVAKVGFNDGEIHLRAGGTTKTGMILVRPGDLLVSGINAAKGAIAVYGEENIDPIAATIHYGAYAPNKSRIDVMYAWWLLRSPLFRNLLLQHVPGGIKTELKAKRLLPIPVPLPPLDEQRRIVGRVEEIASKVEEARRLRRAAEEEAEAMMGALTAHLFANENWPKKTLAEVLGPRSLKNGISVKSSADGFGVRCLTLSSMRLGRINLIETKPVPLASTQASPFLTRRGDVFVVRGNGSKHLVGRAGIVQDDPQNVVFPDLYIRIALRGSELTEEFFVAAWNSPQTREVIEEKAKTTSGIWKVNQGHVVSVPIPVPSLEDQRRVVAELARFGSKIDQLRILQIGTGAELDALLPSVLARAFRGELYSANAD